TLGDILHRCLVPALDAGSCGHLGCLAFGGLAQGEGDARGGLGQVFAEYKNSIVALHVADGRRGQRAMLQEIADGMDIVQLMAGDSGEEVIGADQLAQGEVAFQAGAGRADADDTASIEQTSGLIQRGVDTHAQPGALDDRLARTVLAVDVAIAEAAAVAQEVVIHRPVEAVLDAANLAITLTGADIAAGGTAMADARGELHVPFAAVALGVGLVGEYAGGADLGQVARELALQRTVLDPAEVHLVIGAEYTQVGAAGIVLVIAQAAIAGDTTVHLVSDEWPQLLILVGPFAEAVAPLIVAGHHRHVLQVTVTTFLAHRAIMRVVDHQPLDDAGAEGLGFLVVDRDPAVVRCGSHARHDQPAAGVVLVAVLLDRALAAGAHATQRRVPAEIGDIKAKGQAGLQQVVRPIDFVVFTIYMNSGHGCPAFLPVIRALLMEFRCASRLHELDAWLADRCRGADTGFEFAAEILDCAAQRLDCPRRVGAEGLARPEKIHQACQYLKILGAALAAFQRAQGLHAPGQAVTARRTPAAGLAGEELLHVAQQRHHADGVINRERQPGAHACADLADTAGIHLRLQVFR